MLDFNFYDNKSVFIVAEMSANHNNDFSIAVKTIEAIAKTGADAVKIQTYKPNSLTLNLNTGYFAPRKEGLWEGYTPWELYSEAAMPYEWHAPLQEISEDLGLIFFSTPFDKEGVDLLESMQVPIYKIASMEITDIPLIDYIASKRKPIFISTGLAEIEDIELAISTCRKNGNNDIVLLKCTSQYPASLEDANLLTIEDMKKRFGLDVGVSDHTLGRLVPIVAVSLGAKVVEKHFTLSRAKGGVDSAFSMEPHEFKAMVEEIRLTEKTLGSINYGINENDKRRRRSIFAVEPIKKGEKFNHSNIRSIRPGYGIAPKYFNMILGNVASRDIKDGEPINWEMVENVGEKDSKNVDKY